LISAANALTTWAKGHFRGIALAALLSGVALVPTANAQQRAIDPAKSVLTVRVYKAGIFSALGHDHEIAAPISSGSVDAKGRRVELHVRAGTLRVRDPNASQKDRDEIQKTLEGSEVLDVNRYPEIEYRATSAESTGPDKWTVHGELKLHGQSRPVTVEVREQNGHYVGAAQLAQSMFGITPVKVAGGTIKVKDEVRIEFDIQLAN
jgi:polyisoprenoid-binding protein YceI